MVMVVWCAVDTQTVPWATHATTQASADEHIESLIDRGKRQGRMVLPERLVELLGSGMAVVLFEGRENHHSWTSGLKSCSMQSRHSLGHGSVLLLDRNHSEFGIHAYHNQTNVDLSRGR